MSARRRLTMCRRSKRLRSRPQNGSVRSRIPVSLVVRTLAPYWTAGLERASIEQRAWVAVDDRGSIVGFAVAWVVDGEGHLDELAVTPAYGRRGVGRALVEEVVAWTVAQGLASITLTTFRDVPWNAPYYEKLGFHVVSTLTPALQALVDEQATWGLDPSLRVVMRRPLVDQTN